MSHPAMPPRKVPSGMAQNKMLTYTESNRLGAYSESRATTLDERAAEAQARQEPE